MGIHKAPVLTIKLNMNTFRLPSGVLRSLGSHLQGLSIVDSGLCILSAHQLSTGVWTHVVDVITGQRAAG